MTTANAWTLVVDLTRQLSAARREREAWRCLAIEAIECYSRDQCMVDGTHHRRISAQLRAERDALIAPRAARERACRVRAFVDDAQRLTL